MINSAEGRLVEKVKDHINTHCSQLPELKHFIENPKGVYSKEIEVILRRDNLSAIQRKIAFGSATIVLTLVDSIAIIYTISISKGIGLELPILLGFSPVAMALFQSLGLLLVFCNYKRRSSSFITQAIRERSEILYYISQLSEKDKQKLQQEYDKFVKLSKSEGSLELSDMSPQMLKPREKITSQKEI